MASVTLNSVNFGAGKSVRFDYVGLRPLKMHQTILSVRPHSVKIAPRMLAVKANAAQDDGRVKKMGKSDEECEAAVVAGNIPEAPPVPPKPAAPVGTPVATFVSPLII